MNTWLRRFLGFLMVLAAVAGIAFTIYIGMQVWRIKPRLVESLNANLTLIQDIVATSSDLLVLVDDTLLTASQELDILLESILSLTNILQDAGPLMDSLETLTGEDLPSTLDATQTSLETAQQSADIIDNLLRTLSRIPFFPGDPYDPEVPLSESLNRISTSLDSIGPAMKDIQTNLASSQENLAEIDTQLTEISDSAVQIQNNLSAAQNTITQYQQQLNDVDSRLTRAQDAVPVWVDRLANGMILILIWLGLAQIGLFFQGVNMMIIPRPVSALDIET